MNENWNDFFFLDELGLERVTFSNKEQEPGTNSYIKK